MHAKYRHDPQELSTGAKIVAAVVRIAVAIAIPLLAFGVLYAGFLFLRDSEAPKWLVVIVAVIWGVGGVALLYWVFNWLVEQLPDNWIAILQPFVFVGPRTFILTWFLALPTIRSFWISLFDRAGPPDSFFSIFTDGMPASFVGLDNYKAIFTERLMREAFRNNILWIVFGSTFSVIFGLIVAVLADRSRWERLPNPSLPPWQFLLSVPALSGTSCMKYARPTFHKSVWSMRLSLR